MVDSNAIKDAKVYEKTLEEIISNSAKIVEINKHIGYMNTFSRLSEGFKKVSKSSTSSKSGRFSFLTAGSQLGEAATGKFLPGVDKITSGMTLLSKVTNASKASQFAKGFSGGFTKIFKMIPAALRGVSLLIKPMIGALMGSLGPLLLVIAAAAIGLKILSSVWKVNAGGIQTIANLLRGKFMQGMAKINLAFVKLARELDPILKPIYSLLGWLAGGLIDIGLGAIESLINSFRLAYAYINIFSGALIQSFGIIISMIGKLFPTLGISSLGENVTQYGKNQLSTGLGTLSELEGKNTSTNTTTNNNITFNVSGSSMSEDSYLAFSNKILGVIG